MIAEYERAQIAERSRRGKRHRAKAGSVNVLSGAPYGYRYLKKSDGQEACYVVDQEEAAVVRQIYEWYTQEDLSLGMIARQLTTQGVATRKKKQCWERSVVWAILRNPAYAGRAAYGKTEPAQRSRITRPLRKKGGFSKRCSANRQRPPEQWIEIAVPALVSEPVYLRAQERLAENQRLSKKNTRELTLLQGVLVCGRCGYSLYRTSTRTTKRQAKYYRCLGSDRWRHLMETPCECRPIRVEDLDDAVWNQVENLLEDPALIRAELDRRREESLRTSPVEQRRQRLEQELHRYAQQIDKLLDAYQEGLLGLTELRQRMPALRKKQTAAQKELESAHWQAIAEEQFRQIDHSLDTFLGRIKHRAQSLSIEDKQKIVRLLVKEVVVEKDTITVRHCLPLTNIGVVQAQPAHEEPTGSKHASSFQVCTGSHHSALRCSAPVLHRAFHPALGVFFHDRRPQPSFDQFQDAAIAHPPFD
jgi:site-specific DNA recombinase